MGASISQSIDLYLDNIKLARSEHTARSYGNALKLFSDLLETKEVASTETAAEQLPVDAIAWFAAYLKKYSPATERLYLTAVAGFFQYLSAENISEPNLPRMRMLIQQRSRRYSKRLPQFPRSNIEDVLSYAQLLTNQAYENTPDRLRNMRDRAFLIVLADTGLRVHEACALRRGDIDWNEGKAIIIGKGNRQDVVRFSKRSMDLLRDYLKIRSPIDGSTGRPLASLALFARHDRGAGKKIKPITTTTGRNIVTQRVKEALGEEAVGTITPHSFRHYFVTTVLQGSGGNLKLAQVLARHKNISVTQQYAHLSDNELDRGYCEVFEK